MKQKQTGSADAYHHGDLRRALIDASLALVSEEQDWTFSLREVARRAGVSHNAPYNHFADKHDLLVAIAAAGFEALRERMLSAVVENPKTALIKSAVVYVSFGLENPARYRLMFGSALAASKDGRPSSLANAAAGARGILEDIIYRGAQAGVFAASPRKEEELQIAVLAAWSTVHGLTMLAIDHLAGTPASKVPDLAEKIARMVGNGIFRK